MQIYYVFKIAEKREANLWRCHSFQQDVDVTARQTILSCVCGVTDIRMAS